MSLKVKKRHREILDIINADGTAYITEIANLFSVTKETVRNDFNSLAQTHDLVRIHGGVKKNKQIVYNEYYQYQKKKSRNVEEKKKICFKAVDLIKNNDCIYVDAGSTVSYLINYLKRKENVTLVTPSIVLLMKYVIEGSGEIFAKNNNRLIFAGGHVNKDILTTTGTFFNQTINDFNFDKMFFSVDAVDIAGGITNSDEEAYSIVKSVFKRASCKILLVDESKFGYVANYRTLSWEKLDFMVTDKPLEEDYLRHFEKYGVKYIRV
ncbi:MAG: DeoR/GlpR family DNA-binding transcription regulator [Clostridiales bacterium]|nr:DeoR/GlpR family DNA-binding transcription regulator [Clostridiales bacterium]